MIIKMKSRVMEELIIKVHNKHFSVMEMKTELYI